MIRQQMDMGGLRAMFLDEAATRMATLTDGLLRMEQGTADAEVVELLLRQTHSLKGSAGLVGMPEVGTVAHLLEDAIEAVKASGAPPDPEMMDGMLALADRIQAVLTAETSPPATVEPTPSPDPEPVEESAEPIHAAPEDPSTVRLPVSLQRLDDIVRLSGQVRTGLVRLRTAATALSLSDEDLPMLRDLERTARLLQRQVAAARTVPVSRISTRLQRAVRDAARARGVWAEWQIRGGDTDIDRYVLDRLEDALLHMVRNSVAHGIEPADVRTRAGKAPTGVVRMTAESRGNAVRLTLTDDGRGLDRAALVGSARALGADVADDEDWTHLVFRRGLSTASAVDELAGRGVGLDVVTAAMRDLGGSVSVDTEAGEGTTIVLNVPLTLAVTRCLEVLAAGGRYALPLSSVVTVMSAGEGVVDQTADGPVLVFDGSPVPLLDLGVLLGAPPVRSGPIAVLKGLETPYAIRVDALERQRDITLQSVSKGMPPNPAVLGTSIASDGSAMVVLDPRALRPTPVASDPMDGRPHDLGASHGPPLILVVDDAMTIRELQRSILEREGYAVVTANDGRDALATLSTESIDLVITDVEMPRMDGFALTEAIRQTPTLTATPVVILTSLDDEEGRRRGLEAGADGYLLKRDFTALTLLAAVRAQVRDP